jgi:hypothetical protein
VGLTATAQLALALRADLALGAMAKALPVLGLVPGMAALAHREQPRQQTAGEPELVASQG